MVQSKLIKFLTVPTTVKFDFTLWKKPTNVISSNMIGFEIIQITLGLKKMFICDNDDKLK